MGKLWKTLQNTLFKVILSGEGAEKVILQFTGIIGRGLLLEVLIPWHFWLTLIEEQTSKTLEEHLWQRDVHTGVGSPHKHNKGMGSRDVRRAPRASVSHARFGSETLGWTWKLCNL